MFFAVIWKNKTISLAELQIIKPTNIFEINDILIWFDTDNPILLNSLGWIIKRWEIIEDEDLDNEFKIAIWNWKNLLGINDKDLCFKLKKKYWIKRFKITETLKTDKEIKNKWIELIKLEDKYWIVRWYQNIWLYEKLDFEKPSRSMQMWMMPAKFTHIMANIWLSKCPIKSNLTIYDPFAWSGTTWFIANKLWYNFIWSDINISHLEKNKERWSKQKESNNKIFEIFQHDITKEIPKDIFNWDLLIVSEWWLWPIVKETSTSQEIAKYQNEVRKIYKWFITNISKIKKQHHIKAVFTIPYYINQNNFLEQEIKSRSNTFDRKVSSIWEIYSRERQKVGRKIMILE